MIKHNFSEKFKNMIDKDLPKEYPKNKRPINIKIKRIHTEDDFVDLFCKKE